MVFYYSGPDLSDLTAGYGHGGYTPEVLQVDEDEWMSELWAHLPHEVVVLEQVYMLGGQDPACEGSHLGARFDPGLGEDAQTFSWDGALGDDHLAGQHQAGQLLHLCKKNTIKNTQSEIKPHKKRLRVCVRVCVRPLCFCV